MTLATATVAERRLELLGPALSAYMTIWPQATAAAVVQVDRLSSLYGHEPVAAAIAQAAKLGHAWLLLRAELALQRPTFLAQIEARQRAEQYKIELLERRRAERVPYDRRPPASWRGSPQPRGEVVA